MDTAKLNCKTLNLCSKYVYEIICIRSGRLFITQSHHSVIRHDCSKRCRNASTGEIFAREHVHTDRVAGVLGEVGDFDPILRSMVEGFDDNVVMDGCMCDSRSGVDSTIVFVFGSNKAKIFEAIVVDDGLIGVLKEDGTVECAGDGILGDESTVGHFNLNSDGRT